MCLARTLVTGPEVLLMDEPTSSVDPQATLALEQLARSGRVGETDAAGWRFVRDPEREREILRMRFDDGLTQTQIAERVGISQMHVSRLIRRSLEKIRDEIASDERAAAG